MSNDAQAHLNAPSTSAVFVEICEEDEGPEAESDWHRRLALAREHAQEETRFYKLTWTDMTKRARNR